MKRLKLVMLTLMLSAAGSGLWAAAPESAALVLPELDKEMAQVVARIKLEATVTDSAGKRTSVPTQFVFWKPDPAPGAWRDKKRNVVSRLNFPLSSLKDTEGLKVDVKYDFRPNSDDPAKTDSMDGTESVPFRKEGGNLIASATLPFELVSIDAGGLKWGNKADKGLAFIPWKIIEAKKTHKGKLTADNPRASIAVAKHEGPVRVLLNFGCWSGKRNRWPGNGKDIRKTGLNVSLTAADICKE